MNPIEEVAPEESAEPKKYRKSFYNHYTVAEEGSHLLFNGSQGSLLGFSETEIETVKSYLLNGYEESRDEETEIAQALVNQGFLVEAGTDEVGLLKMQHNQSRFRTDVLPLTILPTLKCNFRCVYCYESFPNATMDEDAEDRIVKYVRNRVNRTKSIPISWFGGEPLTQFDRMYTLTRRIIDVCEEAERDIEITTSFTSNCYLLTPEKFSKLEEMRLSRFQVTIDGTEESHDQLRVLAGGGATYDRIISNLVAFSESDLAADVSIQLRVNCNKEMMESVSDMLEKLPQSLKNICKVYFRNIWLVDDRGKWKENDLLTSKKLTAEDSNELHRKAGTQHDVTSGDLTLTPRRVPCIAADNKSLIIGPDGEIYKCTLELARSG